MRRFLSAAGWVATTTRASHTLRSHSHRLAVVEAADQGTFRAREGLIWGEVQASLNLGLIQHRVVFAPAHKQEASQLGKYGSGPIEAIQPRAVRALSATGVPEDELPMTTAAWRNLSRYAPLPRLPKLPSRLSGMGEAFDSPSSHDFPAAAARCRKAAQTSCKRR